MTDKIIIDGIEIIGCEHYWNGTCHAYTDNIGKFLLCSNKPNCYYKQLKRKEQESEELRKYLLDIFKLLNIDTSQSLLGSNCIEFYAIRSDTAVNMIKELKQECKKLKTKITFYKKYEKERSETHKDTIHDLVLLKRYKQKLDDIELVCRNLLDDEYMRSVAESLLNILNGGRNSK